MQVTLKKAGLKDVLEMIAPLKKGCMRGSSVFSLEAVAGEDASTGSAVIVGVNPSVRTTTKIPATVTATGKVCFTLDGGASEILAQCPGPDIEFTSMGDSGVHVISGPVTADIPTVPEDKMSVCNPAGDITSSYQLSGDDFLDAIKKTAFTCRGETYGEVTNCVAFLFSGGKMTVLSTDRKRISVCGIAATGEVEQTVVLPEGSIHALLCIIKAGSKLTLGVSENTVTVSTETASTSAPRAKLEYPLLLSVLPKAFECTVTLNRTAFLDSIKRMIVINENCLVIDFDPATGKMMISAKNPAVGELSEVHDVSADKKFSKLFRPSYLQETLEAQKAETVNLRFVSTTEVAAVSVSGDPDYMYLVMPMSNPA
jgi:DNA polymerase-3 subunit beta